MTRKAGAELRRGKATGRLCLAVLGAGVEGSFPLPEHGDVVIGRARGCDVRIPDKSVSREHARLRLGVPLSIEDLGSVNGTWLRGGRLEPRAPALLSPGEAVEIGSATVVVQYQVGAAAHRVWPHRDLEARLEEECARGRPFALLRLACTPARSGTGIDDALAAAVRTMDVVASRGPGQYDVLAPELGRAEAQALAARLEEALGAAGVRVAVTLALFPDDGADPYALVARASGARVRTDLAGSPMDRLHHLVERVAGGSLGVLIVGETGVGKDVLATRIHESSPRAGKPFLRLNCAAFSETLLESELFGHERGAFTGALQAKPGLLELAAGGTVLLDEIGEVPVSTQAKLLRVVEDKEVWRVGAVRPRAIDVRFLAATNRDLAAAIADGTFRRDLYYRLAGIKLVVPPLRERAGEIDALAEELLASARAAAGRPPAVLLPAALERLRRHAWPGNVRELKNVLERASLLAAGEAIGPELIVLDDDAAPAAAPPPRKRDIGREDILRALQQSGGNQKEAAKRLGIALRTLINKIERHGLPRPRKR